MHGMACLVVVWKGPELVWAHSVDNILLSDTEAEGEDPTQTAWQSEEGGGRSSNSPGSGEGQGRVGCELMCGCD